MNTEYTCCGSEIMTPIEALTYLNAHHKAIAAALYRGSSLATEIMAALDERRAPAQFVQLAEQWKAQR
jgi:hypothetical protein